MTTILIVLAVPFFGEVSPTGVGASSPAYREPVTQQGRRLASEVRMILSLKCAECHSSKLARPKGKFGHVEDLKQVANNPKLVVPFQPNKSKLWRLVRDNEMPPKRAKAGLLTVEQKDFIRDWIESGAASAGDVPASAAIMSATQTGEHVVTEGMDVPFFEHLLGWLGKFHVLVVHFPIALLVVAAVGELWSLCCGIRKPAPAVRFCVLFAAAGAAAAVTLGWLPPLVNMQTVLPKPWPFTVGPDRSPASWRWAWPSCRKWRPAAACAVHSFESYSSRARCLSVSRDTWAARSCSATAISTGNATNSLENQFGGYLDLLAVHRESSSDEEVLHAQERSFSC